MSGDFFSLDGNGDDNEVIEVPIIIMHAVYYYALLLAVFLGIPLACVIGFLIGRYLSGVG